ncbi:DUF4365 domain-containing protein [Pseudoalteromonas sp. S1608]|uniref:DUF4365 domain-containing protein n=1 Tax=unclassified Pseudoalteromonas TaxID=194690 RepID=UPI00110C0923|nr:DUF4365 domain-containing protein [Pseudoalteromonas sp. S1608]TMP72239.1 hypothetical protein CWB75_17225 [Pseudoalteromonas sp. S1608]
MKNLPTEGNSQEIGRLAGRALGNKLPKSWIEKELDGDSDFGIDYLIQLKSEESLVSFSFYLQLKGTASPRYSSTNTCVSYDFKVKTLQYYHQQEPLVMVAVVDLQGNENELWKCPIYYCWLDEDWFEENKGKLQTQQTISLKIPTNQLLDQSLNIYDFYSKRLDEKFAVDKLKKGIQQQNRTVIDGIEIISSAVHQKPKLLESLAEQSDAPWLTNPEGTIACELKRCSEYVQSNNLETANKVLTNLFNKEEQFTQNEYAEYHYQKANILSLNGLLNEAESEYLLAFNKDKKERYHLGYLDCKFRKDPLPPQAELEKLIEELDETSYQKCLVKAKCLSILDRPEEAIKILEDNHPERIIGQMVVSTISGMGDKLEILISEHSDPSSFSDREAYIFNSLAARYYFYKATGNEVAGEVLPMQGKRSYDLALMEQSFDFTKKAWSLAKILGYPSDIIVLLDISVLIYGYFDALPLLKDDIESILSSRPENQEIIRPYTKILFNTEDYNSAIKLLQRLEQLNSEDCGMLMLSYYNLGKKPEALKIVKESEKKLLENTTPNPALLFCVAMEIANELFEPEFAEKYKNIVKEAEGGDSYLAIHKFITSCNTYPDRKTEYSEELYKTYFELGKPTSIAEQLFGQLDPYIKRSAEKVIELGENLMKQRELRKNDYLHLAQAFLTTQQWKKAEEIARENIQKGISVAQCKLILSASLNHQGHVGEAYKTLKDTLEEPGVSRATQISYINLCLSLGLLEDVVEVLRELYSNSIKRGEKIYFLKLLINIYSGNENYLTQLERAIDKYGELVDQNDCEEEGQFLSLFLRMPSDGGVNDRVKDFQKRLTKYTERFPNSRVLKKGLINPDDGPSSIIKSINEIVGITDEQVEQWEKNKRAIRNDSLPVPFSMRHDFLSNTGNIFTSWSYSLNYPDEFIEFRIKQAPQAKAESFTEAFNSNEIIFILEETSLLILAELEILDLFLENISGFSLLRTVFNNINQTAYAYGEINNLLAKRIQLAIQKHLDKLILLEASVKETDSIALYTEVMLSNRSLLITDDLYLSHYIKLNCEIAKFANTFNVIEHIFAAKLINNSDKYDLVAKACDMGLYEPNMRMDLLIDLFIHYLDADNVTDYTQTKFKSIFDKLFEVNRNRKSCRDLLFKMLNQVELRRSINVDVLYSLFKGFLIRHPIKTEMGLISVWFIYKCFHTAADSKSVIYRSEQHFEYWLEYEALAIKVNGQLNTFQELITPIIQELLVLEKEVRERALIAIMNCFVPMTQESESFTSLFKQASFNDSLMHLN